MPALMRLVWAAAWLVALAGPAVYLLWPSDTTWWVGLLMPLPLVGLAASRDGGGSAPYGGGDGGVWAPPGDGGM